MVKMKPYKILHILLLLLFLTGMTGAPAQGKTIEKPVEEVGMCPDDLQYLWHGQVYTEPGTYTYTKTLPNGDKEKYTLQLYDKQLRTITVNILEGSKAVILGKTYTTPGTYYDTIYSMQEDGCDTIVRLNVKYGEYFHEYDTIHKCEDDPWPVWHGIQTDKPGTYYDPHPYYYSRDSIYQLTLIEHYNTEYWDTIYVCSPQTVYYLNGRPIRQTGDYDSNVKSPYGCDSILHARIEFIKGPDPVVNEIYFCGNISIIRRDTGMIITKPTSLFDTIPTERGCDSIIETRYIPYPTHLSEQVSQIYEGKDTVPWRGNIYTEVGVYYDTLPNQYGCDSIFQLRVIPKTDTYITISVCVGEKATHGSADLKDTITIAKDTLIIDTLINAYGGDSLIHTSYVFVQPFHVSQSITICSNQYVTWKGHIREGQTEEIVLHEAGVYRDEHRSVNECDSSYTMVVTVLPAQIKDTVLVRCNDSLVNNPLHWKDSKGKDWWWSEPNTDSTFRDTMAHTAPEYLEFEDGSTALAFNTGGCDSIINWRIVTGDFCSKLDTFYMCGNNPVMVDNKKYTQPGVYLHRFYSSRNLGVQDSVHNFEIVRVFPTEETMELTLHQLETPYQFHDTKITKSGSYTVRLLTQYGCDSVIHLNVTVLPTITKPAETILICPDPGSYYQFPDGRRYSEPGTYRDTVYGGGTINDTIVQITLKWADKQFYDKSAYFLHGESYTWIGHQKDGVDMVFTEPGVYWDSCINKSGCDSIYRLELKEAQPFFGVEDPITLCSSELPYTWHNKSITAAGTYHDSLSTVYGLDSVWEIQVNVNPSYTIPKLLTLCPNETFTLTSGRVISGSAMSYREEYTTALGCDSIIIYYINRPEAVIRTTPAWFERGTVYTWTTPLNRTILCDHAGHYFDTLRSSGGCDSIIYELMLTEENSYFIREDTAICRSEGEYFLWHGKQYFASGIYYDSTTTVLGLDSVYELHLTINSDTVVQSTYYLCPDGDPIDFFGHPIDQPGVYRVTIPRETTGCDSIVEWVVQYDDTREIEKHITLCEGESQELIIGGKTVTVTQAGIYRDTVFTPQGCEKVTVYYVTVGHPFFLSTEEMINPGSTYTWIGHHNDIVLSVPGTYWDSCTTVLGCDSIYKLTLRLNQAEYIFPTENDFVCTADLPYVWHNKSLTQTGLYYDSLKTNKGLDSIYSIYLTVYPTIHDREELHFCQGDRPIINGIPYEKDAVFRDTLSSYTGCDSIVDYVLHFHSSYTMAFIVNLIDGEEYQFGDTIIKTSGTYSRKFTTQYGCDSLVTIQVNSCPTPQQTILRHELCQGEDITIGDKTITTTGTYYETRTNVNGCDSIVCHIVNVHTAYLKTTSVSVCRGSTYTWRGHFNDTVLDKQGVYYDSLTTTHGCDSIYRLILNYKRSDIIDTVISICESSLPYRHNGVPYYKDSVFVELLGSNTDGCDSIRRWNYRINRHCSDFVQYHRCPGEIITIDGLVITEQGAYAQEHLTETGEDSLYRFTVHDVKQYEFTTEKDGCDSVVYNGHTYYARGTGHETFTVDINHRTVDGCDSIEHLVLTIYMSSPAHSISKTIADYDSIRFGPYWYNTPGSHALHYTNAKGCDSTEILELTVLTTAYPEMEHYYICEGDPKGVEIFGRHYYPTEEYTYIADTAWISGLPVIRTADITIQHPFTVTSFDPDIDQIVCSEHEVLFYVNYSTRDRSILPDYYDVDFLVGDIEAHPLHQTNRVDGKTTLPILMGGQGKYVSPGYYRYRLTLRSEACVVSDTILEGSVVVRYPDNIMESAWNDAVMLVNEKYNGGSWVFHAPYKWQVFSEQGVDKTALVVDNATQPYLYSSALEEGDRISATLYREGYDRPIPSCEYIFRPTLAILPHAILVYPSAVKAHMPVTISSSKAGSYRLFDYTGHLYQTGSFGSGETQVIMPGVAGCYIMVIDDENGRHQTQKLIVF